MIRFVAEKYRNIDGFQPCPFCGGSPELLQIEGEDFIMRCSDCHASTQKARMGHEEAIADWNAGEIIDDHYAITMDRKIDEYLRKGVKGLWMSEYSIWEPFPVVDNDHLFSWLYVFAEDIVLLVDNSHEILQYEVWLL